MEVLLLILLPASSVSNTREGSKIGENQQLWHQHHHQQPIYRLHEHRLSTTTIEIRLTSPNNVNIEKFIELHYVKTVMFFSLTSYQYLLSNNLIRC